MKLRRKHLERIEAELRAVALWEKTGKTLDQCVDLAMKRLKNEFGIHGYVPPKVPRDNIVPCSYCGSRNHLVGFCPVKQHDIEASREPLAKAKRKCHAPHCKEDAADEADWCQEHLSDVLGHIYIGGLI